MARVTKRIYVTDEVFSELVRMAKGEGITLGKAVGKAVGFYGGKNEMLKITERVDILYKTVNGMRDKQNSFIVKMLDIMEKMAK